MAHSYNFAIFMILSISFTLTSVKGDLIDEICSKTDVKKVCYYALREDPRSKGAKPEGLMAIVIDLSQKNATFACNLVSTLLKGTTDPKLKSRYTLCLGNYNKASDIVAKMPDLLKSKDYYGLSANASAAIREPSTCDNNFIEPPVEVPKLREASDNLRGLIDVILVLVGFL
ncbi:pectinesterase inhibitor-like [Solanum lycopersicum]|uniref:Pectinesterase inhibitor domain-containing protein n=1 Tax=Solanum lycopersicum TaxID=4081 RepID=A0A3Q7GEJ1_SOLLC|nr:pectinesterase inhibitor-like [Solanum lycopersicum]